jgi:GrpB-like predicted nucleotidyltransferase (UPF0157 family)
VDDDAILIGGREERVIEIVDYQPEWAHRFLVESRRIMAALGPVAHRVEHFGSTAVPGLAAKPIVDIMVTVDDPDDESAYLVPLEGAGYVLRVREPGHRMLRTPGRDVHLHVWAAGSEDESRHMVFRDWLRSNAADRALYERAKRELAGRFRDLNRYAEAKGPVIERIMERTRRAGPPDQGGIHSQRPGPPR